MMASRGCAAIIKLFIRTGKPVRCNSVYKNIKYKGYAKSKTANKTESKNTVPFVLYATKFLMIKKSGACQNQAIPIMGNK